MSASLSLEAGTQVARADGTPVRPFARAGVTIYDQSSLNLNSSFEGAPVGIGPFTITNSIDFVVTDTTIDVDVIDKDSATLKLNYDGQFGRTTREQNIGGRHPSSSDE